MIKLSTLLPKGPLWVACSGGLDSMVLLDFLLNKPNRKIMVAHFNHGTEHGRVAESFVRQICDEINLDYTVGIAEEDPPNGMSKEDFWRRIRNDFFRSLDGPVLTAHHLNDAMEWWIFSALHGNPRLIPIKNDNILRPFLTTSKQELVDWAERHDVEWVDDPSNNDTKFIRNLIRHELMPKALLVNPGLAKTLRKKYECP